ncbi:inositol-phosphate phosphatase [Candidatus Beckwithbacteria bacterium]|nr:inositol-phosphate phosphatase [Candidatus Beckwithbacteria bacterium]
MNDFKQFKKVALDAVAKAETIILKYFQNLPHIETKIDNTPVTQADQEAEAVIIDTIKKAFPSHGFMGEEFGSDNEKAEFTWIIDPIDGTKNFIHGLEFFGTILGLKYQNKIVMGISNMPVAGELLYASKTEPTTLNGKRAYVSKIPDLESAFVNFNPSKFDNPKMVNIAKAISARSLNMRGFGDVYGYHLVATGRSDVFFEIGPKAWDVSAFQIIIPQAGGKYSDFEGNTLGLGGTSLATNGLLHEEMLRIIKTS